MKKPLSKMLIPQSQEEFEMMQPFEMCNCGHTRSDHGDTIIIGHGRCNYGLMHGICKCIKFTWNGRYDIEVDIITKTTFRRMS